MFNGRCHEMNGNWSIAEREYEAATEENVYCLLAMYCQIISNHIIMEISNGRVRTIWDDLHDEMMGSRSDRRLSEL